LGTVRRLSQFATHSSGNPSPGPSGTSDRMPLTVLVRGATTTADKTGMAASRLKMRTGRRPAGGPRSAQWISPRLTTPRRSRRQAFERSPREADPGAGADTQPRVRPHLGRSHGTRGAHELRSGGARCDSSLPPRRRHRAPRRGRHRAEREPVCEPRQEATIWFFIGSPRRVPKPDPSLTGLGSCVTFNP
jgi:hypothetical protein